MTLRVSGKNFDIGEALRGRVLDRIDAATSKYFDGSVTGHVVIDHDGAAYRTDCVLHLASGITLHSEGRSHEPYISVDQAADRLEKRLRRYKQRLKGHHHHGNGKARGAEASEIVADTTFEALEHDEHPEEFHPVVVAEQTHALRQLSVSEAVVDLDMTGAPVLVFRHATSNRVNVVYRRPDGNISWLDPGREDGGGRPSK
jgi:ribosomal subunit interface protein